MSTKPGLPDDEEDDDRASDMDLDDLDDDVPLKPELPKHDEFLEDEFDDFDDDFDDDFEDELDDEYDFEAEEEFAEELLEEDKLDGDFAEADAFEEGEVADAEGVPPHEGHEEEGVDDFEDEA